ncbi:methylated-DNA--[protein]-cysteine S-methyltransferase [Myroides sp. LJL110]
MALFLVQLESPLGQITAVSSKQGICYLMFSDWKNLNEDLEKLENRYNTKLLKKDNDHISNLRLELNKYFNKELFFFKTPLDFTGSDFELKVWNQLQKIPSGKLISYKKQALDLSMPLGCRAVASCNARNRIMILIPCHRVIGSNGQLSGYAGGFGRKKYLIDLESNSFTLDL